MGKKPRPQDAHESAEGISRRGLFVGGSAAAAAAVLGGTAAASSASAAASPAYTNAANGGDGDLLFVNGKIHTYDDANSVVDAVRIRDGRFIAVGKDAIRVGNAKNKIDLRGRTVIPGIIDSHNHIALVSNRPGHWVGLEDVFTHEDAVARLVAKAETVPEGELVTSLGPIVAMQFPSNTLPDADALDAVPRPVMIMAEQGGNAVNHAAVAYFAAKGITITLNAAGYPTGNGIGLALQRLREEMTDAERERNALATLDYYATLGITTHLDSGAFHVDTPGTAIWNENAYTLHRGFLRLDAKKALPVRMRFDYLEEDSTLDLPRLTERLKNAFPFFGNDMLRSGGIGEFTVRGFGAGSVPIGGPVWLAGAKAVAQAGWRNENHSLSATDIEQIVSGWEAVHAEVPIDGLRWVVSHVPNITAGHVERLKAMGVGVKVGWGPTRTGTNLGPRHRMLLDSGIPVGYHSDGGDITAINPWFSFYTMITGRNLAGSFTWTPGEQVTRDEMIRLATKDNTWFIREDDLGGIKVGNHGDLLVLDRDFYTIPDEEIPRVRSDLTVVGGDIVYDSGKLPGDRSWAHGTNHRYRRLT
ncbi:amidohydrolase [Microbacterium sp.]|uniref:amidohydrolase n=1 Tax=Microbacterium sp. TaxID=51671 RepID=UPI002C121ACE|nr:amidohydrolase family protein [Microbacterium sp.]HWL77760.1 amidohydrolase family protein [Microbacterium sp.]